MYLVPRNVGIAYANEQNACVRLYNVTVYYQVQLAIKAFCGFRLGGAFKVCFKFLWTADESVNEIWCWYPLVTTRQ